MAEELLTFQKFNEQAPADELGILLGEHNIEFLVEDSSGSFDPTFTENVLNKEYRVKIKAGDFEKADALLEQLSLKQIASVADDYPLYSFTDEELMEVVLKKDEWSPLDFVLARKILKDRGKEITPEVLNVLTRQRLQELSKTEPTRKLWIFAGYISALLGGFVGLLVGWHLSSHRKTLPNGDRVFAYSESDRKDGNRILILAIISIVCWVALKMWYNMQYA